MDRVICLVSAGFLAVLAVVRVSYAQEEVPSVRFIAAALQDQENRSSPALSAKWTVTVLRNGKKAQGVFDREWYVRTNRGVFFVEFVAGRSETEVVSVDRYRYDRNTDVTTSVGTNSITGQPVGSRVTGWQSVIFKARTFIDPLYLPVAWDDSLREELSLIDLVKKGRVEVVGKQVVDGHPCWGIKPVGEECTVWLDPEIGFCPRLMEERVGRDRWEDRVSLKEYKEVTRGVWFPMVVTAERRTKEGTLTNVMTVTEVTAGVEIPEKEIAVEFEPGMEVVDQDLNVVVKIPEKK